MPKKRWEWLLFGCAMWLFLAYIIVGYALLWPGIRPPCMTEREYQGWSMLSGVTVPVSIGLIVMAIYSWYQAVKEAQ